MTIASVSEKNVMLAQPAVKIQRVSDEKVTEFFRSKELADELFVFDHRGKNYNIRLIHNPEKKPIDIGRDKPQLCENILLSEEKFPSALDDKIFKLIPSDNNGFCAVTTVVNQKGYSKLAHHCRFEKIK